jgi:uncharacterized protein (TIGR00730 family)
MKKVINGKSPASIANIMSEIGTRIHLNLTKDDEARLKVIISDLLAGFAMMMDKGPVISVFGSSRLAPDGSEYKLGVELGNALANLGFTVLTGGGPGLMEAVNKGAHEANGNSIGINIAIPDEQVQNPYAFPSITIHYFFVRKYLLMKYSSAYIFLPGGFGTLDELFETMTLLQTKKITPCPVVLVGKEFWRGLMDWIGGRMERDGMISSEDKNFLNFADTASEVVDILKDSIKKGTLNLKQGR